MEERGKNILDMNRESPPWSPLYQTLVLLLVLDFINDLELRSLESNDGEPIRIVSNLKK